MDDRPLEVSAEPEELWWAPEAFFAEAGTAATPIDVTGRSRILFWGPYVQLPPGCWRAEASLEICPEAARYDYLVEFGSVNRFSRSLLRAAPGARVAIEAAHESEAPWRSELRIWVRRAAFHGELRLLGVRVRRIEPTAVAPAQG